MIKRMSENMLWFIFRSKIFDIFTEAFFLFSYLEYGQRYGITDWQKIANGSLEETLLEKREELQRAFEERWTKNHLCDKPGCESCVIIDADLKPHRMLCAAKLCGVREFSHSGVRLVTGCTAMPGTKNKYCFKHRSEESPILTSQDISSGSRESLKSHRKEHAHSSKAQDDQIFIIESIKDIREVEVGDEGSKRKLTEFKVKWSGFPDEASTWEPEQNIPKFIQVFYKECKARLGMRLPNPTIKYSKTVGTAKYHFLSWGGKAGGSWLKDEDFFDIVNGDGENISIQEVDSCNTRKSRDKRTRRHTVGLFVVVKPCGTVVLCDELYGSESISQVYGILVDWLANLSDMSSVKILLYDDNCHLGEYAENAERASLNPVTTHLANMGKYIDKFHFSTELENMHHRFNILKLMKFYHLLLFSEGSRSCILGCFAKTCF